MADNLPDEIERLVLDWLLTEATVARPVLPLVMRLMTTNGTDSTLGTEVAGDQYDEQQVTFGAATTTSGVSSSQPAGAVTFPVIDSTASRTIVGAEIWDSGVVPRRILYGALSSSVAVPANQPLTFAVGSLKFQVG